MKRKKTVSKWQSNKNILGLGALLLLSGLSFFGYRLYAENQENKYFVEVEEIQKRANEKLYQLNQKFLLFQSDPRIAKQVLPQFEKAQKVLEKSRNELSAVKPVPKAKIYHQKLILLYTKSAQLSGDLASVAEYLKTREKLFINLAKAVETFGKKMKKADTDQKVIDEAASLRKKTDRTLNQLKKLTLALNIYSSTLFKKYLEQLSQSLTALEKAIAQKDTERVKTAAAKLNKVLSQDWSKAFIETDAKGINSYQGRVEEINQLQSEIRNLKVE